MCVSRGLVWSPDLTLYHLSSGEGVETGVPEATGWGPAPEGTGVGGRTSPSHPENDVPIGSKGRVTLSSVLDPRWGPVRFRRIDYMFSKKLRLSPIGFFLFTSLSRGSCLQEMAGDYQTPGPGGGMTVGGSVFGRRDQVQGAYGGVFKRSTQVKRGRGQERTEDLSRRRRSEWRDTGETGEGGVSTEGKVKELLRGGGILCQEW